MKIFSKITAALLAAAVVGTFGSNVAYARGHHARAVAVDARCYQNVFRAGAFCNQDGTCSFNGSCDVYGICRNGGICNGMVSQPPESYGYYSNNVPDDYTGYYSWHHSEGRHRGHHY